MEIKSEEIIEVLNRVHKFLAKGVGTEEDADSGRKALIHTAAITLLSRLLIKELPAIQLAAFEFMVEDMQKKVKFELEN